MSLLLSFSTTYALPMAAFLAAGPRRPGEGVEDEEQGILSAEEVPATGWAHQCFERAVLGRLCMCLRPVIS
jgi:hypothetical protein